MSASSRYSFLAASLLLIFSQKSSAQNKAAVKEIGVNLCQVHYLRDYSRHGSHGVFTGFADGAFFRLNRSTYSFRMMFSYSSLGKTPSGYLGLDPYYSSRTETQQLSLVSAGLGFQKNFRGKSANPFYAFADLTYSHELWKGTTYVPSLKKIYKASTLCDFGQLFLGLGYNISMHRHWNFSTEFAPSFTTGISQLRYSLEHSGMRMGRYVVMAQGVFRCRFAYVW